MQTPMMPCHLIPMWHEWNMNANDIMMTWLASYVSDITSGLCIACMHEGACALCINSVSKDQSGLACIQAANLNLGKITASHFQVLDTQNANENMPNMIPIAYLNSNLMECNENLAWGK